MKSEQLLHQFVDFARTSHNGAPGPLSCYGCKLVAEYDARTSSVAPAGEQEDSACSLFTTRGFHDWRWLGWPLSSPNCIERWCDECKICQVPVKGKWTTHSRTPSVSPQQDEECNHCTCWPNPTCNCVRPCAACRKKAAVSPSEEEIARELVASISLFHLPDEAVRLEIASRIAAALRSRQPSQPAADKAKRDGLFRAIEILRQIPLSNEHGEREAWPAIRQAIKAIEAEI